MSDYRNTPDPLVWICERCGAMVWWTSQTDHRIWHRELDDRFAEIERMALGIEE